MTDYQSLLKVDYDAVKPPQPLAAGHYVATVTEYEFGDSSQKGTPFCRVFFGNLIPDKDVDPTDNAEIDFSTKQVREDFYLTDAAMFRLKDFMDVLGIQEGQQMLDRLPFIKGKTCKIHVARQMNRNNPSAPPFNVIDNYLDADAEI